MKVIEKFKLELLYETPISLLHCKIHILGIYTFILSKERLYFHIYCSNSQNMESAKSL
jgi:hypothetical protein